MAEQDDTAVGKPQRNVVEVSVSKWLRGGHPYVRYRLLWCSYGVGMVVAATGVWARPGHCRVHHPRRMDTRWAPELVPVAVHMWGPLSTEGERNPVSPSNPFWWG